MPIQVNIDTLITVATLAVAIIWQAATMKSALTSLNKHAARIDTQIEGIRVKIEAIDRRLSLIEGKCLAFPPENCPTHPTKIIHWNEPDNKD